jgi:enamine deaminase RidA (YjgF/YER057c/UK114 family)
MSWHARLAELGIRLPTVAAPVAAYVPAVRTGSLVFTSGQLPFVVGYVASAEGFSGQPRVVNGASELLGKIFGEAGQHARSAVGVAELPLGAPVEVELTVELR